MPSPLIIDNQTIPYTIRHSARAKKQRIVISLDGTVEVVVPQRSSTRSAERFVQQHKLWIYNSWSKMYIKRAANKENQLFDPICWEDKGIVPFQNTPHTLNVISHPKAVKPEIDVNEGIITIHLPSYVTADRQEELIERVTLSWLYRELAKHIEQDIETYSKHLGVTPKGYTIKRGLRRRWGSCSSKKNLNFNFHLIFTPPEVLTYVVIHELCHLRHMNHSKNFWHLVGSVMPEYDVHRKWLKKHGDGVLGVL